MNPMGGVKFIEKKKYLRTYDISRFERNFRHANQSEWRRWYEHDSRRNNDNVSRRALDVEVDGRERVGD